MMPGVGRPDTPDMPDTSDMPPPPSAPASGSGSGPPAGARLLQLSVAGTALFIGTAAVAVLVEGFRTVAAVVDGVLFFVGIVAFLAAYVRAIARSRTHELGVGGIFFLSGSAPRRVRSVLLGALAVQVAVALVTASLRPFTPLAFGMLVPMFGMGVAGVWGAFHGTYPARSATSASLPIDE